MSTRIQRTECSNLSGELIATKVISKCAGKLKFLYRNTQALDVSVKKLLVSSLLQCHFDGLSKHEAFVYYLGGLSSRGDPVPKAEYLARGRRLIQLREEWFSKWL